MAALTIRTWGDPILKTRARPVGQVDDRVRQLIADMFETMRVDAGVGLAANQVGIAERIFIAEVPTKAGPAQKVALINPVISFRSKEKETQEEGCLSFPGIWGPVERSRDVEIQGTDPEGRSVALRGSGLLARAFQHELDHLDGIVFIERMSMVHRMMLSRSLRDLAQQTKTGQRVRSGQA